MRHAAKRDGHERAIIQALEAIGVSVAPLSMPGVPDLLCWTAWDGYRLVEVKTRSGKLTPAQVTFRQKFPVLVARSVEEALSLFGVKDSAKQKRARA